MTKFFSMAVSLMVLIFAAEPIACEAPQELTLVVGNVRARGGVANPHMSKLVGQETADFSHTKSFPQPVVSLDIAPRQSLEKYEHVQLDFVNTSSRNILKSLEKVRPTRIFFEWFPSCVFRTPGNNIIPLLLPALRRAFDILPAGGEVLIDHMPFVVNLPDEPCEEVGEGCVASNDNLLKLNIFRKTPSPARTSRPLPMGEVNFILRMTKSKIFFSDPFIQNPYLRHFEPILASLF